MSDSENTDSPIVHDTSLPPVIKNKRGQFINVGQKKMLVNLLEVKRKEQPNSSITPIEKELSTVIGISDRTIHKIFQEYLSSGNMRRTSIP